MTTLLEIADELYALPLGEFTPARDARAKALKKQDADLSAAVKALRKPALAAWVVNLFARREGEQVTQVLDVGAALRAAQEGMSGAELRELTKQRRQLTAAITTQARALAREEGVRVTPAVADQVEATLTAAMVSAGCGEAVRSGLLVTALTTTGIGDVDLDAAVAVPEALGHVATPSGGTDHDEAPSRPDLRVVPDPDAEEKARAAAQEHLTSTEVILEDAQGAYDEAVADVDQLRARQLQVEAEIDELKRRIADLEETYDEVDDELGDAEAVREEAEVHLASARSDLDEAAAALARLS